MVDSLFKGDEVAHEVIPVCLKAFPKERNRLEGIELLDRVVIYKPVKINGYTPAF